MHPTVRMWAGTIIYRTQSKYIISIVYNSQRIVANAITIEQGPDPSMVILEDQKDIATQDSRCGMLSIIFRGTLFNVPADTQNLTQKSTHNKLSASL
jgi:hypothetical protein